MEVRVGHEAVTIEVEERAEDGVEGAATGETAQEHFVFDLLEDGWGTPEV